LGQEYAILMQATAWQRQARPDRREEIMTARIFYRMKMHERDEAAELIVVAVQDLNVTMYQKHLSLAELRRMAECTEAELVELPRPTRQERGRYHGEEDVDASAAI
jgi:hypothetical protein